MKSHKTIQGLDWLSAEVETSLAAACDTLGAYQASQDDGLLASCLDCFHQVHGCLKITEFDSGALLLAEMEQVVVALRDKRIGNVGDACDVLIQAAGVILPHLARLQAGASDHTGPLVPILNDLRAARGEQLFSELAPFSPHLAALEPDAASQPAAGRAGGGRADKDEFRKLAKKLRQHYQAALLGLLRDQPRTDHFRNLDKVVSGLVELCGGTTHEQPWRIAGGFVEGLLQQRIPWGSTARSLLRELERELRGYVDLGSKALAEPFPRGLLVNLLYYIAIAGGDSPRATTLRERFRLDEALPGGAVDGRESALETAVVEAVASGLHQELETVKERVEEFIASGGDNAALAQAAATLRRMADTLAMANQLDLQQCCQSVVQFMAGLDSSESAALDTLAASIVDIEAGLAAWRDGAPEEASGTGEGATRALAVSGALVQLLEETGRELQVIKQAVLAHLKTGAEAVDESREVPPLAVATASARNLATVLRLAAMDRCAVIIDTLGDRLASRSADADGAWQGLDALADTIIAVEYYLDNRCAGRLRDDESLLGLAELALARLTRSDGAPDVRASPLAGSQAPAGNEEGDPEIREIFVEEAREVLDTLGEHFPVWAAEPANGDALTETRRAFHTLKGSGRMVGADAIGEFAWALENLLNRVIEGRVAATPPLVNCLQEAISVLPGMVSAFEQQRPCGDGDRVAILTDMAERLANGEALEVDALGEVAPAPAAAGVGPDDEDRQLLEIFTREAQSHLAVVRQFIIAQRAKKPFQDHPTAQVQSALHTLKGSAHMAAIEPLAELITPLERFMRDMLNFQVAVDEDVLDLLADSVDFSERMVTLLGSGRGGVDARGAELAELLARITELRDRALGSDKDGADRPPVDPAFLQLLMADGMQGVLDIEHTLEQWRDDHTFDTECFATVARELTELQASAEKAGYAPLAVLAGRLAACYDHLAVKHIAASDELVETLAGAHETLLNMVDAVAAHQEMVPAADAEFEALAAIGQLLSADETLRADLARRIDGLSLPDDRDDEIIELFLGEADELLESMEQAFQQWRQSPGDRSQSESLQRSLHTFKGGARMAGLTALGEISHDLESVVVASEEAMAAGDVAPIATMLRYHDALSSGVERVRKAFRIAPAGGEAASSAAEQAAVLQPSAAGTGDGERSSADILPFVGTSRGLGAADASQAHQAETSQEMVRVSASVLDMLVNLAGETSIS
ncbi:MAG: Hpt domain-containing protein, partial [Bacteroidales bacterium]|nr:Hpt domain-containing protein [Bacteroidales bacterium]